MALHPVEAIPTRLLMWSRVREYAVPPLMIETATARRAVGDWAGACAAARFDVDLDLRAVRHRHGTEFTTRLRADLRHLAPDLLRWHMPRIAPDGLLRPGLTISLARYGSSSGTAPHLVVRTPPNRADAGQRISLALWEESDGAAGRHPHPYPDRRFRLDLHRHLWDARRSGELTRRCGADLVPPGTNGPWASAQWAAEAELLLRAEGCARGAFTVRLGPRRRAVFALVAPDDSHAPTLGPLQERLSPRNAAALPVLPEAAARTLPDPELLRAGLITADRLHPLVAAALASSVPAPGSGCAGEPGDPHRVECRGEVHRIALRDGRLTAVDHDTEQLRREELLVALGGPALPCLRAIDAAHRSPEALPAVRERLRHGDVTGALTVIEGLLGPRALLRDGPLRAELESAVVRRIDHGLFRSGLTDAHPAAAGRRRPGRRMPVAVRGKSSSRARPRTGQAR
jgi:hypothetical protein